MTRKLVQDAAADRFAGTIMASRHGQLVFQGASGFADRAARTPVTMDTRFRIGSANKMFTAAGKLQLVEKGALALDAPIGTYLKDYPNAAFAKTVTIRQFLSHTGGAGDIFTPEYEAKRQQVRTLADYVTLFGDRAPDISAAGKDAYANYGFVLSGRIIEVVSGEDYYSYVQRKIFAPAGMASTGSLPESVVVPNRSRGYVRKDGKLADNADTLPYRGSAAGGGYTTAADMIRFSNALRSGKLLSKAMLAHHQHLPSHFARQIARDDHVRSGAQQCFAQSSESSVKIGTHTADVDDDGRRSKAATAEYSRFKTGTALRSNERRRTCEVPR